MTTHSSVSPSSAHRWFNCPGSVRLCEDAPIPPGTFAQAEGSVAHSLGEAALKGRITGQALDKLVGTTKEHDGFDIPITQEMVDCVRLYVRTVWAEAKKLLVDIKENMFVEQQFFVRGPHEAVGVSAYGTCDCALSAMFRRLVVIDYKHGRGVGVDAEDNEQGLYYAVGATEVLGTDYDEVEIVIIQPRFDPESPVKRWLIPMTQLLEWRGKLHNAIIATTKEDAPLVLGDHCRWCPAAALCPARKKEAMDLVSITVDVVENRKIVEFTPVQISELLMNQSRIDDFFTAVGELALKSAENGIVIPGFKLVEKRGHRRWVSEQAVVDAVGPAAFGEPEVKSVAVLEKEYKQAGKREEFDALFANNIEIPANGNKLVRETQGGEAQESIRAFRESLVFVD